MNGIGTQSATNMDDTHSDNHGRRIRTCSSFFRILSRAAFSSCFSRSRSSTIRLSRCSSSNLAIAAISLPLRMRSASRSFSMAFSSFSRFILACLMSSSAFALASSGVSLGGLTNGASLHSGSVPSLVEIHSTACSTVPSLV